MYCSVVLKNNECFEFLGDFIFNFIIGKVLFDKFLKVNEGELSCMCVIFV